MATLVTGGTGFVGANIVRELAQAGHQVVCHDLNDADQLVHTFLGEAGTRVEFVRGNILDWPSLERLASEKSIDRIVHAAVFTVNQVDLETRRSKDIVDINTTGTLNLLELARVLKVGRFLYVSSGSAYGTARPEDQTFSEEDPPAPFNLYGITKYASELLTRRYGELHGFSAASVRLSTPYGPMERVTGHRAVMSVPYHWTGQALRGEAIQAGSLNGGRDYTYVADIASGVRTVLEAPHLPHDLYNLTAGVWVTFREILEELKKLHPALKVTEIVGQTEHSASLGPTRGPLSGHRLRHDLGWQPRHNLVDGLTAYLQWRRETGFLD